MIGFFVGILIGLVMFGAVNSFIMKSEFLWGYVFGGCFVASFSILAIVSEIITYY